jgi:hypothetical protein
MADIEEPRKGFSLFVVCDLDPGHPGECNPRQRMNQFPMPPRCGKTVEIPPMEAHGAEEVSSPCTNCPQGPITEGIPCGCCRAPATVNCDVFYLCEKCRVARSVELEDCDLLPGHDEEG